MSELASSSENDINKKKHNIRRRLSFMLLDVFFGGFIVSIVLLITLGRPDAESPAEGAGGAPVVLVEYVWQDKHHLFSPTIKYKNELLNVMGFAAPWGAPANGLWLAHSETTGKLDYRRRKRPFTSLSMDGFHLDSGDLIEVKSSFGETQNRTLYYAQILISEPCAGDWEFGLRSVDSKPTGTDALNVDIRVSYSYGDGSTNTVLSNELEDFVSDRVEVADEHNLYESVETTGNSTKLLPLEEHNALDRLGCK